MGISECTRYDSISGAAVEDRWQTNEKNRASTKLFDISASHIAYRQCYREGPLSVSTRRSRIAPRLHNFQIWGNMYFGECEPLSPKHIIKCKTNFANHQASWCSDFPPKFANFREVTTQNRSVVCNRRNERLTDCWFAFSSSNTS